MSASWLAQPSEPAVRAALARGLPDLQFEHLDLTRVRPDAPAEWAAAAALVDEDRILKFAWSEAAATRLAREGALLELLRATDLPVPDLVAVVSTPVLLVTRVVAGEPLTLENIAALDRRHADRVAGVMAEVLAQLHSPALLERAAAIVDLAPPRAQATTGMLREGLPRRVQPPQFDQVLSWCEWVDRILAVPKLDPALVHGDLHGHNQVWSERLGELRALVDWETAGPADAEFDFRYLPAQAATPDWAGAVIRHYEAAAGRTLDVSRIMAWHVLTVLGDALWRSEAGIPLPGGGTPIKWVDSLATRLRFFGLLDREGMP